MRVCDCNYGKKNVKRRRGIFFAYTKISRANKQKFIKSIQIRSLLFVVTFIPHIKETFQQEKMVHTKLCAMLVTATVVFAFQDRGSCPTNHLGARCACDYNQGGPKFDVDDAQNIGLRDYQFALDNNGVFGYKVKCGVFTSFDVVFSTIGPQLIFGWATMSKIYLPQAGILDPQDPDCTADAGPFTNWSITQQTFEFSQFFHPYHDIVAIQGNQSFNFPDKNTVQVKVANAQFSADLSFRRGECYLQGDNGMYRQANADCGLVYAVGCTDMKPAQPTANFVTFASGEQWVFQTGQSKAFMDRQLSSSTLDADIGSWHWIRIERHDGTDVIALALHPFADPAASRFQQGTYVLPSGKPVTTTNVTFACPEVDFSVPVGIGVGVGFSMACVLTVDDMAFEFEPFMRENIPTHFSDSGALVHVFGSTRQVGQGPTKFTGMIEVFNRTFVPWP